MEQEAKDQPSKAKGTAGRLPKAVEEKASQPVGPYWLTPSQKVQYDKLVKASGLKNQGEFFRQVIFVKGLKLYYVDENTSRIYAKLGDIQSELRDIGVNYNQAVKAINSFYKDTNTALELAKLRKLTKQMLDLFRSMEPLFDQFAPYNQKLKLPGEGEAIECSIL